MKQQTKDVIYKKSAFLWLAVTTIMLLLVPFIAMQFTPEVNWSLADFVIMGVLLFSMGSLFILVSRIVPNRYRWLVAMLSLLLLLFLWAELAVGIFTDLGS